MSDSIKNIKKALETACDKAGIKYGRFGRFEPGGFVFHDLRHTFNTNCRRAGIQESVIMKITGHATREMFDRYNSIDKEDGEKAVKKLDNFLNLKSANVARML